MEMQISDPVCGMQIKTNQYMVDYLQVHYVFCSKQCQDLFLENPRLYIGTSGKESPNKKAGQ